MKRPFTLVASFASLACGAAGPPLPFEVVGDSMAVVRRQFDVRRGTFADFTPLVRAVEGPAECSGPHAIPGRPGLTYNLIFDTTPKRRIGVHLDDEGQVVSFTDHRGPDGNIYQEALSADVTQVFVGLSNHVVIAENRPVGRESEAFRLPIDGALDAVELGRPSVGIERVLRECVAAGPSNSA